MKHNHAFHILQKATKNHRICVLNSQNKKVKYEYLSKPIYKHNLNFSEWFGYLYIIQNVSHTVHVVIAVRYLLQQSTSKENSAPHQHLDEINPI